ncbi:S-adenosyl-L-methionine-dependent methyltransferase [Rickenella mellea]|uniref:S-adenosyl-L-methionine-dependent methyltransferase n=1 Tax=Rickenella mellea TaxID=50990 RepID=A0A4Y7QFS1_9AGAM|nr:S-adenosyl-L-methionine-dependent methyltransferase [Rickenella mellea]
MASTSAAPHDADAEMDRQSVATGYSQMSITPSVYSFNSSRDGVALLRNIQGRTFNAQNELYFLPADEVEYDRLEKQHLMHLVACGRLYQEAEKVQRLLAPEEGVQKRILDLGTGAGNWAVGMAMEFPHAQVVGVDLAPSTTWPPPDNCRFEFDDFTLGLSHYYGSFDVVHSRSTANGIKDFEWFVNEAARCLKPGGILLMIEGSVEMLNSNKEPQEVAWGDDTPGQSWMARTLFECYNTMKRRGSSIDAAWRLYDLMHKCPLLDEVQTKINLIPVGPWEVGKTPDEDREKRIVGILMRQVFTELVRALQPLFLTEGYDPVLVQKFIDGTDYELNNLVVHMYAKYHFAWATRNDVPIPEDEPEAEGKGAGEGANNDDGSQSGNSSGTRRSRRTTPPPEPDAILEPPPRATRWTPELIGSTTASLRGSMVSSASGWRSGSSMDMSDTRSVRDMDD